MLCSKLGVSFHGLQETKMKEVELFILEVFGVCFSFDFATSSTRGCSGRILSMWDSTVFIKKKRCTNTVVIV